jgi:DNA mismatch repair protein MutS
METLNARDALSLKNLPRRETALKNDIIASGHNALVRFAELIDPMDRPFIRCSKTPLRKNRGVNNEGGIIKKGYNAQVDELRSAATEGKDWLNQLEQPGREATGIKNLKIGYNRVFGYYIEVTKSNTPWFPLRYERRQTLAKRRKIHYAGA